MSDFFGQLEQQLRQVAEADLGVAPVPTRAARPARRRLPRRRLILIIALLLAAGTAIAATGVWRPILGNQLFGPGPSISVSPPPASQLAVLAVLRRPQTPIDRSIATQRELRYTGGRGVRTDYIRLLRRRLPDGAPLVLVPVVYIPPADYRVTPPPGQPRLPPLQDALCLIAGDVGGSAGGACFSTQQVLSGRAEASLGDQFYGLVPDGVRTVAVRTSSGREYGAPVSQNAFVVVVPYGTGFPTALVWTSTRGRTSVFPIP
jgi:hypothetical protein